MTCLQISSELTASGWCLLVVDEVLWLQQACQVCGVQVFEDGHRGMAWPAGSAGMPQCVVEKNAVYYDNYIQLLSSSNATSHTECCSLCSSYNAQAASRGYDDVSVQRCNLWTW